MENKNEGLVKSDTNQLGFVEQSLQNLDKALVYAKGLVDSKMLPKHYYEDNGTPKPNAAQSALLVIQMGREIGLSTLQSIQQIVPVQGMLSLKGDGAKALIRGSGKVKEWKEEFFGEGDGYGYKITSTRKDTGETLSTVFTIEDAKRAGLWITDKMAETNPKLKYSAWYKYGKSRMLKYRCLGFHSRDMYSDVLQGVMTLEEAEDYATDNNVFVADGGVQVDMSREVKTEESNARVAEAVSAKEAKAKKLAGATAEKVLIKPEPELKSEYVEAEVVIEQAQGNTQNNAGGLDLDAETERLKKLSPKQVADEFIDLNKRGIIPFGVDSWLKHGGSKNAADIIKVIIACHAGKLEQTLKDLKINMGILGDKPARELDEQVEIMDQLEAAGVDLDLLAPSLGFPNKEEMLKFGDKEQILAAIN